MSEETHRRLQHEHTLERLQERYWDDATMEDVIALRDLARTKAKNVTGLLGQDSRQVFVSYKDRLVHCVYVPRHNALRTVLPCSANPPQS